jgi:hypothetical protein
MHKYCTFMQRYVHAQVCSVPAFIFLISLPRPSFLTFKHKLVPPLLSPSPSLFPPPPPLSLLYPMGKFLNAK